ncbi:putative eukaryotic translation initiation factor NCBP [Iris pallida]|uniref:Eukaryotic translation initiation factor NCBP n=1 Tax=Iris pallida TaxID=29817 RepID=A0AAX6IH19_IRIPA|nr:putative eukaryotic translation initiation factor NCBP [Iris pallida]
METTVSRELEIKASSPLIPPPSPFILAGAGLHPLKKKLGFCIFVIFGELTIF